MYIPIYAAQCIALLSFLSNALILAPLDNSKLTIWDKQKEKKSFIHSGKVYLKLRQRKSEEKTKMCVFQRISICVVLNIPRS